MKNFNAAILAGCLLVAYHVAADEPKTPPAKEVVLKDDVKAQLLKLNNEAVQAIQAHEEAKGLLTDGNNSCELATLKRFEVNRAAKVNAWQAVEMSTRYFLKVDPEWTLDLQAGKYHPKPQVKP